MWSTGTSIATPSASSTSALPDFVVYERLPCFATRTPAPAARSAAAVGDIERRHRPAAGAARVDEFAGTAVVSAVIAARSARAAPASSSGVSPFTRSPMSSAPSCAAGAVARHHGVECGGRLFAPSATRRRRCSRSAAWSGADGFDGH